MRRIEYTMSTNIHDREKRFWLSVVEQPWWRHALSEIYHTYDMRLFPIFRHLDRFVKRDGIPFTNRQDIRCHFLSQKGLRTILTVEITRDHYLQANPNGILAQEQPRQTQTTTDTDKGDEQESGGTTMTLYKVDGDACVVHAESEQVAWRIIATYAHAQATNARYVGDMAGELTLTPFEVDEDQDSTMGGDDVDLTRQTDG